MPLFEVNRRFWFDEHFEGETLFRETITFKLRSKGDETTIKYGLASEVGVGHAERSGGNATKGGEYRLEIPVGFKEGAANPPRPGMRGKVIVTARPWNRPV